MDLYLMRENDYDQLFRQLCNLKIDAPCHNGICIGHQLCEYGSSGKFGNGCAIDIVRNVAACIYDERLKQGF